MNQTSCSLECMHGQCVQSEESTKTFCKCIEGYSGKLCEKSSQSQTCRDGSYCLNGSRCIELINGKYYCDCSQANLGHVVYSGLRCEYAAETYCEYGVSKSAIAFCTNGGICNEIIINSGDGSKISDNNSFKGCKCPDGYEGDHCEFLLNQTPDYYTSTITKSGAMTFHMINAIPFFFVLLLFSSILYTLFSTLAIFVFGTVKSVVFRKNTGRKVKIQSAVDCGIDLDPDGDIILEAVQQEKKRWKG